MASPETFTSKYAITGSTVGASYGSSSTFTDNADGDNNSETSIGGQLYSSYYSGNVTLVGTTTNGIVVNNGFGEYLYTNSSYSLGQPISINTSDPYTYCFLEGSLILTPTGEVKVDSLTIGDKLLSADGRELTVRWMGHEKIINRIGASVHKAPIKISAGAFGNGLPHADLYVSNAHAFLIEGHLVVASALVNGDTITSVPFADLPSEFTYWHIETDEHELVVANGVAAETLAGAPERKDFDNYDSYIAEFGADRIIQPMSYPRVKDVSQLPASIADRFGIVKPGLDWDALLSDEAAGVKLKQSNG